MDDLRKMDQEQTYKTLGGEMVSFRSFRKDLLKEEEEMNHCNSNICLILLCISFLSLSNGQQRDHSFGLYAAEWERGIFDF